MNHSVILARFCRELSYDDLPENVILKAKLCILDYIANVYGSLELDAVANVISYIKSLNTSGKSSVFGCSYKTDIHNAAFINGTTAEAIEAQDGVRFGGNHPGAAVIPAALAVGESIKADGKKIIESIVAGYEAANRPSAAMHSWHTLSGFLPTGTCGTFGAAVAAGKLKGLDQKKMESAFGNAGYILPISTAENLMGGYTVKIIQGGQAASSGIMAAGLAENNITGAPYILEGSTLNGGFVKITTAAEPDFEKLSDNLGKEYSIMDVYFKPFTACRHTHGSAQAMLEIKNEKKINPEDVEKIDVFTYGIAELAVGKEVTENSTFVSAQFSIPYVVSVSLFDGELGARQLTEKRLSDKNLVEFSKKVSVKTDEKINQLYPDKTSTRVEITLKNGEIVKKQIDIPKGDPRDPMDIEDISEKLRLFSGERDRVSIDKIINLVLDLENLKEINEITNII